MSTQSLLCGGLLAAMPKQQYTKKSSSDAPVELLDCYKKALAELTEETSNEAIKNCIRLYDPEKSTKENIRTFKTCRKDPILDTLNFLSKSNVTMFKDEAI